ncbi:MAG: leucyl aminopeptidase family protein [Gammaproteobacteria bacterium]|nr:leucyl aminopeptidase family protein [Gammaproteobacteria bacterium]
MNQFVSAQSTRYLSCDNVDKAIPIYSLSSSRLDDWLNALTAAQACWVKENNFTADKNEVIKLSNSEGNISSVIMGTGSKEQSVGIASYAKLAQNLSNGYYKLADVDITVDNIKLFSIGWALSQYEFDHYQNKKNKHNAVLVLNDETLLKEVLDIINGLFLVRDLINTPTCDMGPSHLSKIMEKLSKQYDAIFSELVDKELLEHNFNTIHTVGRAAKNKPRLLDLTWGREDAPKLTLVGKGVCFDTGGLDIKPSSGMRIMKKDMGGAAHTLGLAQMIMAARLDVRLRLLIPAVENNISADAFRPGDIITTYKGTTVEVDNTDAEGRLVLCDALALASEEAPDLLINFATLTGAARVAMGTDVVPFFTDSDDIALALAKHSDSEDDPIWRMPLHTPYEPQLKSSVADLCNTGSGPFGGAITAALFLKHFVDEPENWVHFDMYAWNMSNKSTGPEGGEAMAIRAVFAYIKARFTSDQSLS